MLLNTQGPLYVSGLVLFGEYKYEIGEEKPDGKETDRRKDKFGLHIVQVQRYFAAGAEFRFVFRKAGYDADACFPALYR